ncbi:uncharacterized protein LOC105434363 isoform X2 [Pogonomyrmex barbatus]|uniref:Uncharacterized protein LOC105434363 isoform X2 n=1 Tax=Pogonomyrmex barbatus TaxID=144034 RepID=A0A6I9WVM9_9HYME|nr:uncharacterized protein LOC105434363 isoform X2 [Pogonomyrmex barbatus]
MEKSVEIPRSLKKEISDTQQKLQKAILEHQIYVERLKDDPNNPDILSNIKNIQVYIVSLGRCQKQMLARLRKEVETSVADNANGSKVSIPSLLGLNNNNHITNNNETKHEAATNGFETKPSKEDYEEIVRNGDVHHSPPRDNDCAKLRPSSVETISGEDDVVEVSLDENSDDKPEEVQKELNTESPEKHNYLNCLGLITKSKCMELQNKRVERKRRSTANPQFVYSMFEQPSKRKRHSYLQSGNAPHTRQTTARLNGPSPPPNKTQPTKSTSPPTQTVTKSLIPIQKSTTRPNILRNADSKVFINKSKTEDNQIQLSATSAKSVQSIGNKAVHIPGLPSSLTIERIGSDSIICICCRNPGSLTTCKNCSSNYHVSCHTQSPPPSRICPKCALAMDEEDIERDEEAEVKEQVQGENKLPRYKKDEKFEEKERERYELRERNSDLRLQVYELEKRSQLLGQSLQLQQRMRQDLLGKQEKTQRSIKRLVDFIKLIQLRKNTSSPPSSESISCPLQPSSSRSQTISPPQMSTNQKTTRSPRSSIPNTDKIQYIATITSSTSTHDRASPMSKKTSRSPTPTNCPTPPSNQKSINHISLSRKSPSRLEGPISLLAVKPKTKTAPQFSTTNCRPVAALPFRPVSNPSSPIPCSTIITTVRNKPIAQSHSTMSPYQNCQILFAPSRTTISWTERPSTAGSPGSNSHAANSVSINQTDQPQKSYCLLTATPRVAATSNNDQDQPDQRKKQQQQTTVVINVDQEPSSTHCSQAITSPIPSPIVHVSHEAQTTEIVRSYDSNLVVRSTNQNCTSNQTTVSQQQSSSNGTLSRGSSST